MTDFDTALRVTEILLALAFIQQSLEHLSTGQRGEANLFALRLAASFLLLSGLASIFALGTLALIGLLALHRFQGAYNGGSDRMGLLILWCLLAAHLSPTDFWREMALGYLGVQLMLSYFISGRVKLVNPEWRSGRALADVFAFSAYPVAENLRALAERTSLIWGASWAVILFELAFPLSVLNVTALYLALCVAAVFHMANAVLFGLNRFFWIWLAAYPALIWLQSRLLPIG